ncbi:MAG TPA: hypothetical protein VIK34_08085 [Clostridiaceae bacterium]
MKDSLSKMGEQKAALIEAQNKTKEIQAEVPKAFEKSKSEYIAKIDSMNTQIQDTFQTVLNVGFRQMFFTVFIANLIGFILLLFYKERKSQEI